jgi:hypothetical protein
MPAQTAASAVVNGVHARPAPPKEEWVQATVNGLQTAGRGSHRDLPSRRTCPDCADTGLIDDDGSFSGRRGALVPCWCAPDGDACLDWTPAQWSAYFNTPLGAFRAGRSASWR